MLRKILLILLVSTILIGLGYFIFQLLQTESQNIDGIALVPDGNENVITLERIIWWPGQSEIIANLSQDKGPNTQAIWHQWTEWTSILHSCFEKNEDWQKAMENSNITYAGTSVLNKESWLLVFVVEGQKIGPQEWLAQHNKGNISKRDFKGQTIYNVQDVYSVQLGSGIITSKSVASLEGCILAYQNKTTLIHNTPFMQAYEVRSSDSPLHFFSAYNAKEWLQLENTPSDNGPTYLGLQIAQDSTSQTTVVHGAAPDYLKIPEWLPSSTYYWDAIHFDQRDALITKCEEFYAHTPRATYWKAAWQIFGDSCACDLHEALLSWRNGQSGVVAWDINDTVSAEVFYYGAIDTSDIASKMPHQLLKKLTIAAPIFQIQIPEIFDRNRISSIGVEPTYFMQFGAYALLSNSIEDLLALRSLSTNEHMPPFLQKSKAPLHKASRTTFISSKSKLSTLPRSLHELLLQGEDHLIVFSEAASQRTMVSLYTDDRLPTSEVEMHSEPTKVDSIGSLPLGRSWNVINHQTSAKETLEELSDNTIQLKDQGGKVLWQYQKEHAIIGDVVQIDALKNGKLQYAFTTRNGLHVIDRNGAKYEPLCIASASAVTSQLAVFDYEANKNYRLVFATENGAVVNYTASGTATQGWQYEPQGIVQHLVHFKQGTDDCLLMIDMDGQMHLHKRNGNLRAEKCGQIQLQGSNSLSITVGKTIDQTKVLWRNTKGGLQEQKILFDH